jgi:hypothetical protein
MSDGQGGRPLRGDHRFLVHWSHHFTTSMVRDTSDEAVRNEYV